MVLRSINPYSGQLNEEFTELTELQLNEKLNNSVKAFSVWGKTDAGTRRILMNKVAGILKKNIKEYSGAITVEMGKPIIESIAELEKCAWVCEYYAEKSEAFLNSEPVDTDANMSFIAFEPLGTILGVMPWNFPFWQVFRFAVPTLMAGNTVCLKHASNVQICARHIQNIFTEAGFPSGVFTNLVIGSDKVAAIIEHDGIKGVSLTGSESAGREVAATAGRNIKKSLLELGGSNAFLVLEDADLDKAAEVGVRARMMNAGQSCIAAKRFIINEKVSDRFIELFVKNMNRIKQGDPLNEETTMGPLASIQQAETVERQVIRSVEMGAKIIAGGKRKGAFYSPTLLTDVHPGMPLFDEEVFGPVAPLIIVKDTPQAVALANQTTFGLGVSVFTGNNDEARELAREFRDGAVFVNELVRSDPRLPFGGTGKSGYGRELALQGIREFVNIKTVYIKSL